MVVDHVSRVSRHILCPGSIGIMENEMETIILGLYRSNFLERGYRSYIGIMEKKMETILIGCILGL